MSAPERTIDFTADARADFTNILLFTSKQWGDKQRDRYADRLTSAINRLRQFPELGESRNDISAGLPARSIDQHVVFYRVLPGELVILRILHVRMDAVTELGGLGR